MMNFQQHFVLLKKKQCYKNIHIYRLHTHARWHRFDNFFMCFVLIMRLVLRLKHMLIDGACEFAFNFYSFPKNTVLLIVHLFNNSRVEFNRALLFQMRK